MSAPRPRLSLPEAIEQLQAAAESAPEQLPAKAATIVRDCLEAEVVVLVSRRAPGWFIDASEGLPQELSQLLLRFASFDDLSSRIRSATTCSDWAELSIDNRSHRETLLVVGSSDLTANAETLRALVSVLRLAWSQLTLTKERERTRKGPMLEALTRAVAEDTALPTLYRQTVETAVVVAEAHQALLLLPGEGADAATLSVRATIGDPSAGTIAAALELGGRAFRQRTMQSEIDETCLTAIPLLGGSRLFGSLVAVRESRGTLGADPFAERDLFRLRQCANALSIAMQTAAMLTEQKRGVRELQLLNQVARDCAQLDVDSLLAAVSERLCRSIPVDATAMFFVDQERQELFWSGGFTKYGRLPPLRARVPVTSGGLTARALNARQPRRGGRESVETPVLQQFVSEQELHHFACVPLLVKDRVLGVVAVATREKEVSDEDLRLIQAICDEVAIALDNSRLYSEARRRADDLALVQEVGEVMARSLDPNQIVREAGSRLGLALGCDGIGIYMRRGEGFDAIWHYGTAPRRAVEREHVPETDPLMARVLSTTEPIELPSSQLGEPSRSQLAEVGLTRVAAAPLLVAEQQGGRRQVMHTGAIFLGRRSPRPFIPSDLQILGAVAAQLALALKNAQLYEQTRQRADDLGVVTEAARALWAGVPLEQALEDVSGRIARHLDVSGSAIMLLDADAQELYTVASFPRVPDARAVRIPLSADGISTRSVRERSVQIRRVLSSTHPVLTRLQQKPWMPSWAVAVPMLSGEQVIGTLILSDPDPQRLVNQAELDRALTIANQIAVAIERAQLNARLQKSLSDLAQAQAQLVRRERLAALGELAALVAHEVRNPLGVIVNSLGTLTKVVTLSGDAQRIYDIMVQEAGRIDRIVSDMLDYTRPTEPRLAPGNLGRAVRDAVSSATSSERARGTQVDAVRITVDTAPELPPVPMDDRLLHQAFVNLLSNALQSIPKEGGHVDVATALSGDGKWAEVVVKDDGPGITPEVKARLFEPFFTTKAKGSGLGLAMVKRIVDGHNGEIAVETAPGSGTRFIMRLPLTPSPEA